MSGSAANAPGIVVQVGEAARRASECVSRRRRWTLVTACGLTEASEVLKHAECSTALLIAGGDLLSPSGCISLAEEIAGTRPDLALGLLHARDEIHLFRAGLRFQTNPSIAQSGSRQLTFLHTDFQHYRIGAAARDARSLAQSPEEFATLFTEPAELAYLVGHSNGLDQGLSGIVICRQPSVRSVAEDVNALPCFHGANCRFKNTDFRTVSADHIGAKRVINLTCWGMMLIDHPFDSDLSIGEAFLRHAGVETLLTLVRPGEIGKDDLLCIYYLCNLGLPLGVVANKANQFRLARGFRADIICFGDPESRMTCSVTTISATPSAAEGFVSHLPSHARDFDVCVRLPQGVLPREPVIVLTDAPALRAGVLTDGSLFATMSPGGTGRSIRFELVSKENLLASSEVVIAMSRELLHFQLMLRGLTVILQKEEAAVPPCAGEFARVLYAVDDLLGRWPLCRIEAGSVLHQEELRNAWTTLRDLLNVLGSILVGLSIDFRQRGGTFLMRVAGAYYSRCQDLVMPDPCVYCGQPVDEGLYTRVTDRHKRWLALCRCCGPIYEGDPGVGRWIISREPLVAGRAHNLSVAVSNPFPFDLNANLAFILANFEGGGRDVTAKVLSERLPAGAHAELEGTLCIPDDFAVGTHYVFATVVLGTKLTFLRRPVRVFGDSKTINRDTRISRSSIEGHQHGKAR